MARARIANADGATKHAGTQWVGAGTGVGDGAGVGVGVGIELRHGCSLTFRQGQRGCANDAIAAAAW